MSADAVRRFWHDVDEDTALRHGVEALITPDNPPQASAAAIVEMAAQHGYDFTVEELKQHVAAASAELSDAELEAVSGGIGAGKLLSLKGSMVNIN